MKVKEIIKSLMSPKPKKSVSSKEIADKMEFQRKFLREKVCKHFDTMYLRDAVSAEETANRLGMTADDCWKNFPIGYKEFVDDLRNSAELMGKKHER